MGADRRQKQISIKSAAKDKKILIVDDDKLIRIGLEKFVSKLGFETLNASSGDIALRIIEDSSPFMVLLDFKLEGAHDGLDLLSMIKKSRPEIVVVMISGKGDIHGAVEAMKAGALDYLEKPVDFHRLEEILKSSLSLELALPASGPSILDDFILANDKMRKIADIIQRLALKTDITVLVLGESGTGKNFLCQKIHKLSSRKDYPYVQIGCSNIPETLFESELFGHEKGAFTDAKAAKKGLIEMAQGGTVLLDEIGEMPYTFQAKILSLLEEKRFRRVGSLQDIHADIRLLAATNRNLHELVQKKRFRLDLFYRLNVATIELPPLRERREDIPLLVNIFLDKFGEKYICPGKTIDRAGMDMLKGYSWPGNIRQLKNLIEKMVVLSDEQVIGIDEISSNLLTQQVIEAEQANRLENMTDLSLEAMEKKYIRTAMKLSGGNQRKAADLLKISRDTLRYRLKKLKNKSNYSAKTEN